MIWGYPHLRKPPNGDIDTENIREQQHELDFSKIQEREPQVSAVLTGKRMINHDKPLDLDRAPGFWNLAIFMDQGLEVEAKLQEQEDAAFSTGHQPP
jgi:hypothetical protein